jgi:pyruvate dehydrogenase E2 component (dihydrolipoamide acetyltransferase)
VPLCAIGEKGEQVETPAAVAATPKPVAPPAPPVSIPLAQPTSGPKPAPAQEAPVSGAPAGRLRISPLARKLAAAKGVDYSRLQGTGPGGRIVQADILAAAAAPAPQSQIANSRSQILAGVSALALQSQIAYSKSRILAAGPSLLDRGPVQKDEVVPLSNMRATIARRLVESKTQIPHFYLEVEIDAEPLLALRTQLNSELEKDGVKLSVNDFILKASAEALRVVPAVNCSWEGDPANTGQAAIRHHAAAHVSFAVAIDDGLITPVIRDTHLKTLFQISTEARELAALAKARKLKPEQFTGGTFCVSNLGMMGIERFTAVINPPNAAILAVGATVRKPVVKNERIAIGQRMSLFLSCDHRVVDGATGARYLAALKELLEKPALLLV